MAAPKTKEPWVKVWQCSQHGEFKADERVCPKDHDRANHVMDLGWKRGKDEYTSIDPNPAPDTAGE